MEARLARITGTTDMAAAADADLAVEAVFEDFGVKQEVLGRLDRLLKGNAVIATNTSYLDVDALARATTRPQSVVGMHFFSPANVMRLVEVVRGAATSAETLATAIAVGRKLGKIPAVVGVCHGFVGNRMLRIRTIEAERLLLEGARPQDVDAALTGFGFPMGPFAMADLAGLDVSWRMRKAQGLSAPIADALCERGRFGQKTARGFYLYEAGSRTPKPDPEVEILIAAEAARRGVAQRVLDAGAIVERLLFPMINEGARDPRRGDRPPARRHRHHLGVWLRVSGVSRRPDALRRQRRAGIYLRPPDGFCRQHPATTATGRARSWRGWPRRERRLQR